MEVTEVVKIFVSYKEDDRDFREAFEGLMQNPEAKFNHDPISARRDFRSYGYDEVRVYLNGLIQECKALVCLIGQNTYQSEWVEHELSVASSLKIGIAPIHITNTRFVIPQMIASKGLTVFSWDPTDIRRALSDAFSIYCET